jgi:site-specific recombinase XerD
LRHNQEAMLSLWRRHTPDCPHREKGRAHMKCSCPIWADGELRPGKRFRKSLSTRDWQRAIRKLAEAENPTDNRKSCAQPGCEEKVDAGRCERHTRTIAAAIEAFHAGNVHLAPESVRAYKRTLRFLQEFAQQRGLKTVDQFDFEILNAYHISRPIGPLTWTKELETLRHFFRFCVDAEWTLTNQAKKIATPKNIKPSDKEPYSLNDITKIIAACEGIGRGPSARLRARGMVLLLRYTALRISDVALLKRDRVRHGAIYLRTGKNGKPVFLPVHPDLQAALEVLPLPRGADGPDCPYYFWSGHGTTRSMIRDASRTLAAVFKASGVPGAHAHRFRHTLATEILEIGGSIQQAADILGDTETIVRKHYAKWTARRQAEITGLLARLWHTGNVGSEGIENTGGKLVDGEGFEPTTPALRTPCSPN